MCLKRGDFVLIKDESELKIGKILELLPSEDGEIRQAVVRTKFSEGVFPVFKLRFLEGYNGNEFPENSETAPSNGNPAREKLVRKAKSDAKEKISDDARLIGLFLHSGARKEHYLGI